VGVRLRLAITGAMEESEEGDVMRNVHRTYLTVTTAMLALIAVSCERREDVEPAEERLEVEPAPAPMPGVAEVEIESALPLDKDDVGDKVIVTGTVVGRVTPVGFFVRTTPENLVFFVRGAQQPVESGQQVRVLGTVAQAEVAVFQGWEKELLGRELKAEWKLERLYYIDAMAVEVPMTPTAPPAPTTTPPTTTGS
jgi:hypothetical protein